MKRVVRALLAGFGLLAVVASAETAPGAGTQIVLQPSMIQSTSGDASPLVDEQDIQAEKTPETLWKSGWKESDFPAHAVLDLGRSRELVSVWLYDLNASGKFTVSYGSPDHWTELLTEPCDAYKAWKVHRVNVSTRYLRLTRLSGGANVAEVVLFERSDEEKAAIQEAATRPLVDAGEEFGPLPLVDEVRCGDPADRHPLVEDPQGKSRIETILGQPCRTLPNEGEEAKYFGYRLGKGKLLKPGKTYLLCVDYPEDRPRTLFVLNRGAETARGLHTGPTVGDALHAKYVNSNSESLDIPLSGKFQTWSMYFCLHDRFADVQLPRDKAVRPLEPLDGFPVLVAQMGAKQDPLSAGAAVSRIRLFEVPEPARFRAQYTLPPEGLPRRHLFCREEMADGVVQSTAPRERGVENETDWFEYKARVMQFLGMNTYCKDLLEFGHNQGWDAGPNWYNQPPCKDRWTNILAVAKDYGLDVLPYYEYCGGIGPGCLGTQRRCVTLGGKRQYTHITWSEKANADVTDPDTLAEAKKLLDYTIVRYKDRVPFVGAWFRPRVSAMPISFSDRCLALFASETKAAAAPTREQLAADRALRDRYCAWWFQKRHDFLAALCDHLRAKVDPHAVVLFTADTTEPGVSFADWKAPMVAEKTGPWAQLGEPVADLGRVIHEDWYLKALVSPRLTWGGWEWQYACPQYDPENYARTDGVLMAYPFNRAYTVGSAKALDAFRGPSGLALVRHYSLNENMMDDKLGYFVSDMELAGPFCMLAEARAVAYGDPFYFGYLSSTSFNRGFPKFVREFNTAFLSLPALPSRVLADACSQPDVVVRAIETPSHGVYLAVVNVGYGDVEARVRLPSAGTLVDAPTGRPLSVSEGEVQMKLHPCQMRALHLKP